MHDLQKLSTDGGWDALALISPKARVEVIPELGCDIVSFLDERTGVDVLWRTPWGIPPRTNGPFIAPTEADWAARYPGGWNVLCPNAGDATAVPGGVGDHTWGFHGEAALLPWQLGSSGIDDDGVWAQFSVRLIGAPLQLQRLMRLADSTLTVTETLTNLSTVPIEMMWSHHPAFGAPLIGAGTRFETDASVTATDLLQTSGDLEPGREDAWPFAPGIAGDRVDISVMPNEPTARLVYLSGFERAHVRIVNDQLDLAARLEWDASVFPCAWMWQELNSTAGHPWWKQAYVTAFEPGTTYPGRGVQGAKAEGGTPLLLSAQDELTVSLSLTTSPSAG